MPDMAESTQARRMVETLHAARVAGDLAGMLSVFSADGQFEILGAGADKSIAIRAKDLAEFRPWLAMMVKVFRLTNYQVLSFTMESPRIVAHWRADIYSKVTGVTVPTELVDVMELGERGIVKYTEFFAPR
jgi:ketosteroid isomerase-like protein